MTFSGQIRKGQRFALEVLVSHGEDDEGAVGLMVGREDTQLWADEFQLWADEFRQHATLMEELCSDEGCPQADTAHVCIDSSRAALGMTDLMVLPETTDEALIAMIRLAFAKSPDDPPPNNHTCPCGNTKPLVLHCRQCGRDFDPEGAVIEDEPRIHARLAAAQALAEAVEAFDRLEGTQHTNPYAVAYSALSAIEATWRDTVLPALAAFRAASQGGTHGE